MCQSQSVGSYKQAGEVSCSTNTFVEKKQAGILPTVFQGLPP